MVAIISILYLMNYSGKNPKNEVILTINGESVTKAEFLSIMSSLKGSIYSRFAQKYGVSDSENFWNTSFNGEVPIDILKEETVNKLKVIKVEQILMKNNGIASDISYEGFLQALKEENQRRKKAVSQNEPIYGPVQYDELVYYDVLHQNRLERLKLKLIPGELSPSDADKKYKDMLNKLIDEVKLEINEKAYMQISV